MFWAQAGQNEANVTKMVPINEIKIFHKHDVNDVKRIPMNFWGQMAEMSLRPLTSSNHRPQIFS